jgi:hypothetical protein
VKTISHGGGLQGWSAFLIRYPDLNTTITVLHNSMPEVPSLSPTKITELAADLFLWEQLKPRPKYEVDESVDLATFAAYVGRYDYLGAIMEIDLDGKQLTAQLTGQPRYPIFPRGKDKFFWKVADAQIEFVRDDEGNVISARHKQGGINLNVKKVPVEKVVKVNDAELDHYVGKYEYSGLGVLTVRKDRDKLFAQMTGQPEFEIFPKGDHKFFWKVVAAEIEFIPDKDGKIEKAIHKQSGATFEVKKTE